MYKFSNMGITWYLYEPWEVWMNKVFSTLPTCRARKTTSNVVLPPGGTVWNKNRAQINECIDRLVETWFLCHFPEYHNNTIVVFFLTLVWKYSVFTSKPISEGWMSQFGLYVHWFFFSVLKDMCLWNIAYNIGFMTQNFKILIYTWYKICKWCKATVESDEQRLQ